MFLSFLVAAALAIPPLVSAHPGSGIALDKQGQVYFVDTGMGVWKIDSQGRLLREEGPAYHFMALDRVGSFAKKRPPRLPDGDVRLGGENPTLVISSSFPVAVGSDGAIYYPEVARDGHLRAMRLTPSGQRKLFAELPVAMEIDPDGKTVRAQWIHGLAAAPDGSLYYTERDAIRRIAPDGTVSLFAGNIKVPDCVHPPAAMDENLGPALRGLDVGRDGSIYVAASACSALLKIARDGTVSVVLRASDAWSPTGVAVAGDNLYVLEYRQIETNRREDWYPRVRKVSRDGQVTILTTVTQQLRALAQSTPLKVNSSTSNGLGSPSSTNAFVGLKAGEGKEISGLKLCWCPPGRFTMGSPRNEPDRRSDEAQVEVTLTRGFWMGKFEVTQGQWKRFIGKLPGELTAELPEGDDFPLGNVNFAEAEAFCRKLTELGHASGELPKDWEFRLPTEAQWEYACRAGTKTATYFGDKFGNEQANFKGKPYNEGAPGTSLGRAAKVGSFPANPWGLHDMQGNVVEWCRDWYHAKLPGGIDPDLSSVPGTKNRDGSYSRSRRGSAWGDDGWASRSANRQRFEPERRYDHIGFRVVIVKP